MAVEQVLSGEAGLETFALRHVVLEQIQQFCRECDRFIEWQYREIIRGNPSMHDQEKHRRELQWALRTARLLECVASDPDSSDASTASMLRAKIWQLDR